MKLLNYLFTLSIILTAVIVKAEDKAVDFDKVGISQFNNENVKITIVKDVRDLEEYKKSFRILGIDGYNKFFSSKDSVFLLDLTLPEASKILYDSVVVNINDLHFNLGETTLHPLFFSGLGEGEFVIALAVYQNGESTHLPYPFTSAVTLEIEKGKRDVLVTNDAVVLGILILVLALIFMSASSSRPFFEKFYKYIPALLLCYFIPALLNSFGVIDGEESRLYFVASRYLLPASLILLCINIDLKAIIGLGPKALIMFFTATLGIVIGGPIALGIVAAFSPDVLVDSSGAETWQGFSTVAGSWIGGGANQTAMKEIYDVNSDLFQKMIVVDIFIANIWMAFLLFGAGKSKKLDKKLKADSGAIDDLKNRVEKYQKSIAEPMDFNGLMKILAIAFGGVAIAHAFAGYLAPIFDNWISTAMLEDPNTILIYFSSLKKPFFWLIIIATFFGIGASFTKARSLEGQGASKMGSALLYILVATIGMHMNIIKIYEDIDDFKYLFAIGLIWMLVHVLLLMIVAKIIKAPFFFVAVGSQANVGGAASAPIVASAFSPALATVGVLLAVMGYAVGTFGAVFCATLMEWITSLLS